MEKTFYFNREFWTLRPSQERSHLPAGSVCYNCYIIYMMLISPGDRRLGKYHPNFAPPLDVTNWQQIALGFWRVFNLSQLLQFWKFFRFWLMGRADRPANYKKHIKRGTLRTTAAVNFYLTSWPQGKRAITLSSREVTTTWNKFIAVPLKESKVYKQPDFISPRGEKEKEITGDVCCLLVFAAQYVLNTHWSIVNWLLPLIPWSPGFTRCPEDSLFITEKR